VLRVLLLINRAGGCKGSGTTDQLAADYVLMLFASSKQAKRNPH
jgi:hypothetical protein